MKKLIVAICAAMLVLVFISSDSPKIDTRSAAEKVVETVMVVEASTGVVVYADGNKALILTARHNISNLFKEGKCVDCLNKIKVYDMLQLQVGDFLLEAPRKFIVTGIEENELRDLALIEINTNDTMLEYANIFKGELSLAEDIYIVGNPLRIYRSLKRGVVGSILRSVRGYLVTEIGGGVVFGSSGGGVFTMDGDLAGIVLSVAVVRINHCDDLYNEEDEVVDKECVIVPVPFIGFAATPKVIREFVLKSKFNEYFKYLSE